MNGDLGWIKSAHHGIKKVNHNHLRGIESETIDNSDGEWNVDGDGTVSSSNVNGVWLAGEAGQQECLNAEMKTNTMHLCHQGHPSNPQSLHTRSLGINSNAED
ncbi:hypothetical protein V8B97DRAFT_2008514 [Scleroderma yunnanense]